MKLKFDANQDYQLEAIQAVVNVFEGLALEQGSFEMVEELGQYSLNMGQTVQLSLDGGAFVGNKLALDDDQIVKNVHAVQKRNNIEYSEIEEQILVTEQGEALATEQGEGISLNSYNRLKHGNNFTIEMETGTGKTYVYLRTIHELHRTYGFKKFIIVVPSVAIREGVWKNLDITKEHFESLYEKPMVHHDVWNPKKTNQAKSFATSNNLEILVINIDSFAKNENIMRKTSDYGVPLEYIQATKSIVIVDEPQNMETPIRTAALGDLNPLCTLRYSATHKNYYNLIYKLDPVKAYKLGLVKKIEVDSVVSVDAYNEAYLRLIKIDHKNKSTPQVHIEVDKNDERGLQRKVIKCEAGDDLERIVRREIYAGYTIAEIDAASRTIKFGNGELLRQGEANESLREDILKYQIKRTVENHFEKEAKFAGQGIKVLSLFFIDSVANYRIYNEAGVGKGKFAQWFERAYDEVSRQPEYANLTKYDATVVHNGYFSKDKSGTWKDTKGTTQADDDTYKLIMQDKERLLDNNVPLRFIFSHSALREGWDSPNVFQICTLRDMSKEIERRQTIGRGLRLPVNSQGERIYDDTINTLTVIANENYEDFARNLQTEMEEQGVAFERGMVKEKPKARQISVRKQLFLDENFIALWNKIKHKTRYRVELNTGELIKKVVDKIEEEGVRIRPAKITSLKGQLEFTDKEIRGKEAIIRAEATSQKVPVPDILSKVSRFTGITRRTVFDILDRAELVADIPLNPQQVIDEVTRVIKEVLQEMQIDGIKYEKIGEEWDMALFENKELQGYLYDEASKQGLVSISSTGKTTHDHVLVDSEVEERYARALDEHTNIKFYCKLPSWFKIDTPLGGYNPDWAVVLNDNEKIYFVSETKSVNRITDGALRKDERLKIKAGKAHFSELNIEFVAPTNNLIDTLAKLKN